MPMTLNHARRLTEYGYAGMWTASLNSTLDRVPREREEVRRGFGRASPEWIFSVWSVLRTTSILFCDHGDAYPYPLHNHHHMIVTAGSTES